MVVFLLLQGLVPSLMTVCEASLNFLWNECALTMGSPGMFADRFWVCGVDDHGPYLVSSGVVVVFGLAVAVYWCIQLLLNWG